MALIRLLVKLAGLRAVVHTGTRYTYQANNRNNNINVIFDEPWVFDCLIWVAFYVQHYQTLTFTLARMYARMCSRYTIRVRCSVSHTIAFVHYEYDIFLWFSLVE